MLMHNCGAAFDRQRTKGGQGVVRLNFGWVVGLSIQDDIN
jgi:hypothetical protein